MCSMCHPLPTSLKVKGATPVRLQHPPSWGWWPRCAGGWQPGCSRSPAQTGGCCCCTPLPLTHTRSYHPPRHPLSQHTVHAPLLQCVLLLLLQSLRGRLGCCMLPGLGYHSWSLLLAGRSRPSCWGSAWGWLLSQWHRGCCPVVQAKQCSNQPVHSMCQCGVPGKLSPATHRRDTNYPSIALLDGMQAPNTQSWTCIMLDVDLVAHGPY
jgi:hypothetical protein